MSEYDGYNAAVNKYLSTPRDDRRDAYGDAAGRFLELYRDFKGAYGMTQEQAERMASHHVRNEYGATELSAVLQSIRGGG